MTDLTTLNNVKSYLRLTITTSDAEIQRLITATSSLIRSWINRDITSTSYIDFLNGTGSKMILLPNYPITAISSLFINDILIDVSKYAFTDTSIILKDGLKFTYDKSNIEVHYIAGFSSVPYDIEQVCIELVAKKFKSEERIGIKSKGLAGESVSYDIQDMRDEARTLLASYNKVAPL